MKKSLCAVLLAALMIGMCSQAYSAEVSEMDRLLIEAAQECRKSGMVDFRFRDMDLAVFVRFMSEILSENIVILGDIKQKVTAITMKPITLEEARKIMIKALEVQGLTFSDEGTFYAVRRSSRTAGRVRNSLNITERLGITSRDVVNALQGLDTAEAIKDAASVLAAVFRNQISEPKITSLNLSMVKGGEISLSYKYGTDLEEAASRIAAPPVSSDMGRGRIPAVLIDQFIADPFSEMNRTRMRYTPKYRGLEVQWIQNNSLLRRLGVARGDVIREVNGIKLSDLNDIAGIIRELQKREHVDITVERAGNAVMLNYDVVSDDIQSGDVSPEKLNHEVK
ncbi:MAG: hypothetical protein IJS28_05720 [Synergistaceae bacterium]|nr:hypothetical protein [Synergistaceae bacterium]